MKMTIAFNIDDDHVAFYVAMFMRKAGQTLTKWEFNKFMREHLRLRGTATQWIDGATDEELHLARNLMKKWKLV